MPVFTDSHTPEWERKHCSSSLSFNYYPFYLQVAKEMGIISIFDFCDIIPNYLSLIDRQDVFLKSKKYLLKIYCNLL